jgi:hypothetical protein
VTESARNALSKASGIVLPRFSARLRIPRAAFGESKNLFGNVGLSTAANDEDPPASLGYTEELAVQSSVRERSEPDVGQRADHDCHVPSRVGTEKTGDILNEEKPSRSNNAVCDSCVLMEEPAPFSR